MDICGNHQNVNITKVRVLNGITFQKVKTKQMKAQDYDLSHFNIQALGL